MVDHIFRQYDIRGIVGSELIIDQVYDVARALARYFIAHRPVTKKVVLGMDGRTHSPAIRDEMMRGLVDSGLDVVLLGVCTTPTMYFAMHTMDVDGGVMITASHNSKEYNGIKICLGTASVSGEQIQELKRRFQARQYYDPLCKGTVTSVDVGTKYVHWLAQHFSHLKGMPLKVLMDCGNGTAGVLLAPLIEIMEWQNVDLLYGDVDGSYPHHEADPSVHENMKDLIALVADDGYDLGIGFDGDVDRMAPVTHQGTLLSGDQLLALFGMQIAQHYQGAVVVGDIRSSALVGQALEQCGMTFAYAPSGCAYIKDAMRTHQAVLGGELSCHFFFADKFFGFDDGVYAALRLIEMVMATGTPLATLLERVPTKISSPEFRVACPEDRKQTVIAAVREHFERQESVKLVTIDGVRAQRSYGWGIVRASNTQPVLSVRFEADTPADLARISQEFCQVLSPHLDGASLATLSV